MWNVGALVGKMFQVMQELHQDQFLMGKVEGELESGGQVAVGVCFVLMVGLWEGREVGDRLKNLDLENKLESLKWSHLAWGIMS
jgi:hypothetical protein